MSKAVFLDRDGVINKKALNDGYITRWEDMEILPRVAESIALLNKANFLPIVVTNQRGIAKGLMSDVELRTLHHHMCSYFAVQGAIIDSVYYCPHEYSDRCSCRKPAPGMLLTAARDRQVELLRSWMIGDSDIDVEAGRIAGCRTIRITNHGESIAGEADFIAASLPQAVRQILNTEFSPDVSFHRSSVDFF